MRLYICNKCDPEYPCVLITEVIQPMDWLVCPLNGEAAKWRVLELKEDRE